MRVKLQSKVIYDVFLSYSRKDANIADEIYKVLQKNNIKVFIDTEGIGGARDFAEIIFVIFARKDNSLRINRLVGLLENWVTR